MDWLNQHIEVLAYVAGAVLTFAAWNINQGNNNKNTARDLEATKLFLAKEFEKLEGEVKAVRLRQDTVERGLTDELRRIGEKLAHIEGFLTAKKPSHRPS